MTPDVKFPFDGPQQVLIPIDLEIGVETALHQNARASQADSLLDLGKYELTRENVSFFVAERTIEGAEAAVLSAKIRVVYIAIDNVADDAVRVDLLPDCVRRHADSDQVIALKHVYGLLSGDHG